MNITLTLNNGAVIRELDVNGDCLTSKAPITAEMFSGGLSKVLITCEGDDVLDYGRYHVGEHRGMSFGGVFKADELWYFWLEEPSAEELAMLQTQADIEYVAMMTGVEL